MTAISNGGAAQRVKVLTAADLKANGGSYALEQRAPVAVYGVTDAETTAQGGDYVVMGNVAQPVYVVSAPTGAVEATIAPIPMIGVTGGLAMGNVAIPVYVVGGSLGSNVHPRWSGSSVVYWTLDEVSGNRAALVGGLTLTDNNTVGSAAGIISNAASFVAANSEYLSVADNALLNIGGGDFTVRAWIRPTIDMEGYAALLGKWTAAAREWLFQIDLGNRVFFGVWDSGNALVGSATSVGGTIEPDTTYHIVASRIGADLKVYINGAEAATATISGTPRTSSAAAFAIGTTADVAASTRFNGWIDEVAIVRGLGWDAAQVTYDYNAGTGLRYPD